MTKKIRIGMSAMVAFALMFTSSINVVAQEKVVASTGNIKAEFAAASSLGNTIQALDTYFTRNDIIITDMVMKEPVVKEEVKSELQTHWFVYDKAPGYPLTKLDAKNPANYEISDQPSAPCAGEEVICAIRAIPNGTGMDPEPIISPQLQSDIDAYFDDDDRTSTLISSQDLN